MEINGVEAILIPVNQVQFFLVLERCCPPRRPGQNRPASGRGRAGVGARGRGRGAERPESVMCHWATLEPGGESRATGGHQGGGHSHAQLRFR